MDFFVLDFRRRIVYTIKLSMLTHLARFLNKLFLDHEKLSFHLNKDTAANSRKDDIVLLILKDLFYCIVLDFLILS